jgi:hypothetical protein
MCFDFWLQINLWITSVLGKIAVDKSVDLRANRKK